MGDDAGILASTITVKDCHLAPKATKTSGALRLHDLRGPPLIPCLSLSLSPLLIAVPAATSCLQEVEVSTAGSRGLWPLWSRTQPSPPHPSAAAPQLLPRQHPAWGEEDKILSGEAGILDGSHLGGQRYGVDRGHLAAICMWTEWPRPVLSSVVAAELTLGCRCLPSCPHPLCPSLG